MVAWARDTGTVGAASANHSFGAEGKENLEIAGELGKFLKLIDQETPEDLVDKMQTV